VKTPPTRKRDGQAKGRRTINGIALDIAAGTALIGNPTEKTTRAQIARGLLLYRRLGGRIILLRDELIAYLHALPGVSLEEALANVAGRTGHEGRPLGPGGETAVRRRGDRDGDAPDGFNTGASACSELTKRWRAYAIQESEGNAQSESKRRRHVQEVGRGH
jgi:hypothetical protein